MHRVAVRLALLVCLLFPACGSPSSDEPPASPDAPPFDLAAFETVMAGPDAAARTAALDALLAGPQVSSTLTGVLATALGDENRWVRDRAAQALTRIGPEASAAVPALIGALRDRDGFVRWRSAKALWAMGPAAAAATAELERMAAATDETELGRHWSAQALDAIRRP